MNTTPPISYTSEASTEHVGIVVTALSDAPVMRAFGHEVQFLLNGKQTNGRVTMFLDNAPPGLGSPLHYHEREDEWFYVLEGRPAFYRDGRWEEVSPGSTVFVPRRTVHAFKNVGAMTLRLLVTLSPAGFDDWFAECAEEFQHSDGPDMKHIAALAAGLGMHFVEDENGSGLLNKTAKS